MLRNLKFTGAAALAAATATTLLTAAPALAAAPSNDEAQTATKVTPVPFQDLSSTTEATRSANEPESFCASGGGSIWYAYTPTSNTDIIADTSGSDFDTVLHVFTGTPDDLTILNCNDNLPDDNAPDMTSVLQTPVTAGTTYYFRVDGYPAATGNVTFNLRQDAPAPQPPMLSSTSVDLTAATVDRRGTVTVSGTVTCDQDANIDVAIQATQTRNRARQATSSAATSANCSTTPTAFSVSFASTTKVAFRPGQITLAYTSEANDGQRFVFANGQEQLQLTRQPA